jgi:hypothetical protein
MQYHYLQTFQKNSQVRWECPHCKKIVLWNEIQIDWYVHSLIREVKKQYGKDPNKELTSSNDLPINSILLDKNG